MPNARKPKNLKVVAGTDRKDRDVSEIEIPPVEEMPQAPDWITNAHAVKEWNRLCPILMATKLLTDADLSTLAHLCGLHGKIVQLYAAGEAPTASMITTLRNLQNDFGLSPVARGKVTPVSDGPGRKRNTFSSNGKKRGA
ncbi:MAG: hypothetical protein RKH07_12655 [Gammaproteobacteria bacterium]